MSAQSPIKNFDPEGYPSLATKSYSHISIAPLFPTSELVCLAGQTGSDTYTGPSSPPPFLDQVRGALANVDKCLAAAGCTKANIVSSRKYVVKLSALNKEDYEAMLQIHAEWVMAGQGVDRRPPPVTLVGVESLHSEECLFEFEVTAVRMK